jgi:hypothetical protein
MKNLSDFQAHEIRRVIEEEGWDVPRVEVTRTRPTPGQQIVFWGLRIYVMAMTVVVVWAFLHGAAG